jgi:hypothetical protein
MKTIAVILIAVLAFDSGGFALQAGPTSRNSETQTNGTKKAAKAKAEVQKRGVGEQSRVRVSLLDGNEIQGYISKIEENSFEVIDKKNAKATTISFTDVNKVKGTGLSKPAQVLIVVGVFVGVAGLIFLALLPKT